jgi:hypothetical protein
VKFFPSWRPRATALAIGLALIATACGSSSTQTAGTGPSLEAGPATNATQPAESVGDASVLVGTAEGGQLDWGSLSGKDVVLWFWAPW